MFKLKTKRASHCLIIIYIVKELTWIKALTYDGHDRQFYAPKGQSHGPFKVPESPYRVWSIPHRKSKIDMWRHLRVQSVVYYYWGHFDIDLLHQSSLNNRVLSI